jgi:hypothetical protein
VSRDALVDGVQRGSCWFFADRHQSVERFIATEAATVRLYFAGIMVSFTFTGLASFADTDSPLPS